MSTTQAATRAQIILCADDYGFAAGVSQGILELIDAGRLTATSAIVTLPRWPADAATIRPRRGRCAVGLHLNLTVGAPLGAMPRLAPSGRLPDVATLTRQAIFGAIDRDEIQREITRQLKTFVDHFGYPPDHIDGHQHVHALPGIRHALIGAIASLPQIGHPPLRDPADTFAHIIRRGLQPTKAMSVALLACGFARLARRSGHSINRGFSGFSSFDTATDYAGELVSAMRVPGPCHMVMCHPGYPDEELAALDPVRHRRAQELAALVAHPDLVERIARVSRGQDARAIADWNEILRKSDSER